MDGFYKEYKYDYYESVEEQFENWDDDAKLSLLDFYEYPIYGKCIDSNNDVIWLPINADSEFARIFKNTEGMSL